MEERERRAEQADAPEGDEQADACNGGRQHERELDERHEHRASGKPPRREEPRGRRAEEQDRRLRDERRLERHDHGVVDDRIRELVDERPGPDVREDRDDRQDEKCERDEDREEEREAEKESLHCYVPRASGRKP